MAGLAKTVLITGSTSGIGLGIATQFLKKSSNINLMIHGVEPPTQINTTLLNKLSALNNSAQISYHQADLVKENACSELIAKTVESFGRLDVLINNAGLQFTCKTQDFPTDKWDLILGICLNAPFFLSRAALPHMHAQKYGRLIHIGSAHSVVASANKSAYCAAKHGVVGLSRVLALELAGSNITSNIICPGWVKTPLVQKQIDKIAETEGISAEEASARLVLEKHPTNEFVQPENLGALAMFLCSEEAKQMNGSVIPMDLGWTIR